MAKFSARIQVSFEADNQEEAELICGLYERLLEATEPQYNTIATVQVWAEIQGYGCLVCGHHHEKGVGHEIVPCAVANCMCSELSNEKEKRL